MGPSCYLSKCVSLSVKLDMPIWPCAPPHPDFCLSFSGLKECQHNGGRRGDAELFVRVTSGWAWLCSALYSLKPLLRSREFSQSSRHPCERGRAAGPLQSRSCFIARPGGGKGHAQSHMASRGPRDLAQLLVCSPPCSPFLLQETWAPQRPSELISTLWGRVVLADKPCILV